MIDPVLSVILMTWFLNLGDWRLTHLKNGDKNNWSTGYESLVIRFDCEATRNYHEPFLRDIVQRCCLARIHRHCSSQ
jgi:hypothetical protein